MEVQDYYMSMNICRDIEKKKKCCPCASNPRTTHIISLCMQFCLLSSFLGSGGREAELLISL